MHNSTFQNINLDSKRKKNFQPITALSIFQIGIALHLTSIKFYLFI